MNEELSKFIGKEDCSINELPMFKEFINNITNEELGVLLRKDNPHDNFKYHVLVDNYVEYTDNIGIVKELGTKLTRKEAEQFPQFKFVPLKEMEKTK